MVKPITAYTRTLLLLIVMLTGSVVSFGQQNQVVSGRVVDGQTGDPLPGALVQAGSEGTVSNSKGEFTIRIPEGTTSLHVSYLGFEPQSLEIRGKQTHVDDVGLAVSPVSLDEIVVRASSMNYKSEFKGSNYTINPSVITHANALNTEELLRTVPGVNIVGDMGLSNRPNISIRGSWGRRSKKVLLMEDGSPAAPAPYVAPGAYYNPVSDRVQAIEVYKGADMLRFGPNNMFGAVNYITALPSQKPELRLKLVGGERNYRTALFSYGGTWQNLGALVEAVHKRFDGFTDNSSVNLLNLNAKVYARLNEKQSLYFKVSGQFEDNQASLSSMTPFTFNADPSQHPFDADQFTMRRYGLDILHKWLITAKLSLTSKIYASDFERDWWRQVSTIIPAADVHDYLGEEVFDDRYSYLNGLSFADGDYVRVGVLTNGRESTTDSRWIFTVSGISETMNLDWRTGEHEHSLEAGVKLHQETYKDRFLRADSSRWARHGRITNDIRYHVWSASGFVRNEFRLNKFSVTPILRVEHINMYKQDLLALSSDPDLDGIEDGRQTNTYTVALPGVTVGYRIPNGEIYSSIYRGFIAPSKVFGFFVERDGELTNPLADEDVNIAPEVSLNFEAGWRGSILGGRLDGQAAYFNNTISNFIAAGENELFVEPARVNIQGVEAGLNVNVLAPTSDGHRVALGVNATLLRSRVLSGALVDKDAFGPVVHSEASRDEFIDAVNVDRNGYELYATNEQGDEVLIDAPVLTAEEFGTITRAVVYYGDGNREDAELPYSPKVNLTTSAEYGFKDFSAGIIATWVGEQYAEFLNFENYSGDGGLGKLPSFYTIDVFFNYEWRVNNKFTIDAFINGKNVADNVYQASRLNRAASGIFPGGFRQIIAGVNIRI